NQSNVLQEFQLSQPRVGAQLRETDLPWQTLECAQIRHQAFLFRIVRIGIGIACDFRECIKSALRGSVITEHAIAATYVLELPQSVRPRTRPAPHLFAFNK